MEVIQLLAGLFCLLAAVAVIGHGIWVLVANTLGAGSSNPPPAPAPPSQRRACPRCGLKLDGDRCAVCDWPVARELARPQPQVAIDALARQVRMLAMLQVLDAETSANLSQSIDSQRMRLAAAAIGEAVPPREAEPIVAEVVEASPAPPRRALPLRRMYPRKPTSQTGRWRRRPPRRMRRFLWRSGPRNFASAIRWIKSPGWRLPRHLRRRGRGPIGWPPSWKSATCAGASWSAGC